MEGCRDGWIQQLESIPLVSTCVLCLLLWVSVSVIKVSFPPSRPSAFPVFSIHSYFPLCFLFLPGVLHVNKKKTDLGKSCLVCPVSTSPLT